MEIITPKLNNIRIVPIVYQVRRLGVHSGGKANWLNTYFNPAAFAINAPGTFGNSAKNLLNGPGINTADVALVKNWEFVEHYRLQFRWEMFNALNQPGFWITR